MTHLLRVLIGCVIVGGGVWFVWLVGGVFLRWVDDHERNGMNRVLAGCFVVAVLALVLGVCYGVGGLVL